ncbi:MAG: hypothetical protein AAGH72_13000 [Verrucomicrobiota bacterium]
MKNRYRVYPRTKGGTYYIEDSITREQKSLFTKDKQEAEAIGFARNQAAAQPALNVAMAKAYLKGKSPEFNTRTWQDVMNDKEEHYRHHGSKNTLKRWQKVCRSAPFAALRNMVLIETESGHFLNTLRHSKAGVSGAAP